MREGGVCRCLLLHRPNDKTVLINIGCCSVLNDSKMEPLLDNLSSLQQSLSANNQKLVPVLIQLFSDSKKHIDFKFAEMDEKFNTLLKERDEKIGSLEGEVLVLKKNWLFLRIKMMIRNNTTDVSSLLLVGPLFQCMRLAKTVLL